MTHKDTSSTLNDANQLNQAGFLPWKQRFSINNSIEEDKLVELIDELFKTEKEATVSQGKRLENLGQYLFDNCGFITDCRHNQKNRQHELDHFGECSPLVFDFLKTKEIKTSGVLGESKNYPDAKINVNIVYKVEALKLLVKSGFGIYFARKGMTGDELSAATALLKDFHHRFGNLSILFTDEDWVFLKENPKKFSDLCYEKIILFCTDFRSDISDFNRV